MKLRVFLSGLLLIGSLFLLVAHLAYKDGDAQFCHANYDKCYHLASALTFVRLMYSSIMFPVILMWIKPNLSAYKGINLLTPYLYLQILDFADWYFNYWQTAFRQDVSIVLITITVLYVWWYCWEK